MNIQVFGTKKSFDTKKAQRYFKERRVKFQFIDLREKGMSKGELESVAPRGGRHRRAHRPQGEGPGPRGAARVPSPDQKFDKLLENQHVLAEPVVRNGKQATVGYAPEVWKGDALGVSRASRVPSDGRVLQSLRRLSNIRVAWFARRRSCGYHRAMQAPDPTRRPDMDATEKRYLELLSRSFPTAAKASAEIINLSAILNLPKGTEFFASDIHGEYEAFSHILRNGSGSIRLKIDDVFGDSLSAEEKRSLATLIYYPREKMELVLSQVDDAQAWYDDHGAAPRGRVQARGAASTRARACARRCRRTSPTSSRSS